MAPGALEQLLRGLAPRGSSDLEQRVIAGRARNEDAVVVRMPAGKAIVQTVDILAPIVNDAFWFGRIAACNALSDVYALGGQPWCAMNVAFFPTCLTENDPENILANILRGVYLIRDLSPRTGDAIVSYGERLSSGIVAAVLEGSRLYDAREFIRTKTDFGKHIAEPDLTEKLIR